MSRSNAKCGRLTPSKYPYRHSIIPCFLRRLLEFCVASWLGSSPYPHVRRYFVPPEFSSIRQSFRSSYHHQEYDKQLWILILPTDVRGNVNLLDTLAPNHQGSTAPINIALILLCIRRTSRLESSMFNYRHRFTGVL